MLKESLEVDSSVGSDRLIELTVLRHQGTSGHVVVSWHGTAATDVSTAIIRPRNGTVRFT